jgi:transketolase
MASLVTAIDDFPSPTSDRPTVIICDTVKGKGVDFMEANLAWHAGSLNPKDLARALAALEAGRTHSTTSHGTARQKETV